MIDTTVFKEKLEAEKVRLETELASAGNKSNEGDWQGASDGTTPAIDPNEAADQIEELTANVPIVESLEAQHREVLASLDRIENGTYGVCTNCGQEIPLDRLEANPAAGTCLACA